MDNQPSIDRELLIPILIGGISVIGVIAVLLIGRSLNTPAEVPMTPSATPFRFLYLGTEPAITTPIEESEIAPLTEESADTVPIINSPTRASAATAPSFGLTPIPGTPTRASVSTPLILISNTPALPGASTPTRTSTAAAANTYDDTDSRLTYSDGWLSQTGFSESGSNAVYQGTLHISDVADNKSVTIQFSGREISFYYLSIPSSGIVTIYLDDDPLALTTINQSQGGGVWHYVLETAQTHRIRIEHTGGGSVNVDRFVIPAPTPTPTRTPTPTP